MKNMGLSRPTWGTK